MKTLRALLVVVSACFIGLVATVAYAAAGDTARYGSWVFGEAFMRANGSPIHRATLTPDNSTAESNLTAAGGTAVTYTLFGGERICVQAATTDAYVEVIAAGSFTASGAKAFLVDADASLWANCFTLKESELSVSALCTAAGPCTVKLFEIR